MLDVLRKIQRFGTQYCDLKTMIWNVDVMMRLMAINIDARNKKPPLICSIFIGCMIMAYYYVYVISVGWLICGGSMEPVDRVTAVKTFSLGINSHIAIVKLWFIYIYQDTLKVIVTDYLACDAAVAPGSRLSNNILSTLRIVKRRALAFGLIIMGDAMVYVAQPLFRSGRHMPDDTFILYRLEPMLETPNYQIAMTLTACACFIASYVPSPISGFFTIACGYTEAYMIALAKELEAIWDEAKELHKRNRTETDTAAPVPLRDEEIDNYIKIRLQTIIRGHTTNINLISKVDGMYRASIAVGLLSLIIGLIADLLGGLENTFIQLPYNLLLVGIDCLAGQRLMEANVIFERAVYACNWENFNPSNRKLVLLLLINSQKTMTLTAGTVTILSFETLMNIVKSTYSAYTTLQSTVATSKN